jgi:hypothetical protein
VLSQTNNISCTTVGPAAQTTWSLAPVRCGTQITTSHNCLSGQPTLQSNGTSEQSQAETFESPSALIKMTPACRGHVLRHAALLLSVAYCFLVWIILWS